MGAELPEHEPSPFGPLNEIDALRVGQSIQATLPESLQRKYAGVYVGARGIKGGELLGTHQFLALIPDDPQRFPPPYRYASVRLAPGIQGIVVGAYNVEFEDAQTAYKNERWRFLAKYPAGAQSAMRPNSPLWQEYQKDVELLEDLKKASANRLQMDFFQADDLNAARQLVQKMLHQNQEGPLPECVQASQTLAAYYMRAPIPTGVIETYQSACRATPRGLRKVSTRRDLDATIQRAIGAALRYERNEAESHVPYPGAGSTVFSTDSCLNSNSWVQTLLEVGVDRSASGQDLDRFDACRENRFEHSLFK